jgi:hypothetical protein
MFRRSRVTCLRMVSLVRLVGVRRVLSLGV